MIDYNGGTQVGAGIQLVGSVNQDEILSNSIYGNAGLGINLGDGPTPNHAPGTPGPNDYQNYPTLSLAQSDGSTTTINGSLYSIPNTTFLIQFFASPTAAQSGFGQGMTLVGSASVTTDSTGNVKFSTAAASGSRAGILRVGHGHRPRGEHFRVLERRPNQGSDQFECLRYRRLPTRSRPAPI